MTDPAGIDRAPSWGARVSGGNAHTTTTFHTCTALVSRARARTARSRGRVSTIERWSDR